ncbi:hypothetical protein BH10BAC3_BH10BAC3_02790 [soil metagenome]
MNTLNAQGALTTLLNLMALPGTLMTIVGGYFWYDGVKQQYENRSRYGKMLVMFGLIMLAIVLILTFYLTAFGGAKQSEA